MIVPRTYSKVQVFKDWPAVSKGLSAVAMTGRRGGNSSAVDMEFRFHIVKGC
jgi:hypothetical protein